MTSLDATMSSSVDKFAVLPLVNGVEALQVIGILTYVRKRLHMPVQIAQSMPTCRRLQHGTLYAGDDQLSKVPEVHTLRQSFIREHSMASTVTTS